MSQMLRNILVQAYFGIDWNVVWKVVRLTAPPCAGKSLAFRATELDGPAEQR